MRKYFGIVTFVSMILLWGCSGQDLRKEIPSLQDLEIDVLPAAVNYRLDVDVDYQQKKVFATCGLTVRNPSEESMKVIPLNLYRLMDVTGVTDEKGDPVGFEQKVLKYKDWEAFQVNHIRIALDPPLLPGEERTVEIEYGGLLLGYTEAMRYVKDHIAEDYTLLRTDSMVFPRIGVNDWGTNRAAGLGDFDYVISVTVPEPLIVASQGELMSTERKDGKIRYTYRNLASAWRIDAAVAGFEVLEDSERPLKIFVLPEDRDGGVKLMDSMKKVMALYTQWFGPLKVFKGMTVIEVPEGYGSQADRTAIIQQASGFRNRENIVEFYHELSHLWNVKANDPLPPRFESEGLGMFMQHFVEEKLDGKKDALVKAVEVSLTRLRKYFSDNPEAKDVPMIEYGNKQMTDPSYRMGQIMYYILYELMGEQAFLDTVGGFYQDYFDSGATAAQFVAYFKDKSPVSLDKVFEDWVLTAGGAALLLDGIPLPELIARYK